MPEGRVRAFGKAGCLPPASPLLLASRQSGSGASGFSATAAAAIGFQERTAALSELPTVLRNITASYPRE